MKLAATWRDSLKAIEGLSLEAYPDGKAPSGEQLYSIGYGHGGASKGQRISREQAEQLFDADVSRFEQVVSRGVAGAPQGTTPGQFDALVLLAYNIGEGAFLQSMLLRLHDAGDHAGAVAEFPKWVHSGGVVDPRLVTRRKQEQTLYELSSPPFPAVASVAPPAPPSKVGYAGAALIFFCPYCGGRCAAHLAVEVTG